VALRRNILKRCVSEDLIWAEILKSDNPQTYIDGYENHVNMSLHSTPERQKDIPNEHDDLNSTLSHKVSLKKKVKKGKN
jgi:hypothetical protein